MAIEIGVGQSLEPDPLLAAERACDAIRIDAPDLVLAFLSATHLARAEAMAAAVRTRLRPRAFLGCTVQGTIATGSESESGPSAVVFAARLPGSSVRTFHATARESMEGYRFAGLPDPGAGPAAPVLLLPDPFTSPVVEMLDALDASAPVFGGVASGASVPGGNRLFRDGEVHRGGAVGAALEGVSIRPVVSQGCRPVGRPYVVTRVDRNLVQGLGGRPAAERLKEIIDSLSEEDRALARRGLHVGIVMEERKDRYDQGDFLIRGLMGMDPSSGAIAVTDRVRVGQTLQFQVRDRRSAKEDFARMLGAAAREPGAKGALLFACNGRGSRFFGEKDADANAVRERFPSLPLAGFFAAGEIGPVGGRPYLHGYTASLALFCDPS